MIRTAAFAGVLVLWGLVAYGNRGLQPVIPNLGEREVLPLAFTNPIWVDANGDGKFTPPRNAR